MADPSVDGFVISECMRIMMDPAEPGARRRLARDWYAKLTLEDSMPAMPIAGGTSSRVTSGADAVAALEADYDGLGA